MDHGYGHLLRAALEGVAFALRKGLEAVVEDPELRLAGGRGVEGPWQQLLADVLGRPVQVLPRTLAAVAAARIVALLAGIASEVYRSQEDVLGLAPGPDRSVRPGDAEHEAAYAATGGSTRACTVKEVVSEAALSLDTPCYTTFEMERWREVC